MAFSRGRAWAAAVAGLAAAAASLAAGDAEPAPRYVIELDIEARQSGVGGRAELLAGARLLMSARRSESGDLTLGFERALEAPWKLSHVDPFGPFGRQTKVAAVITLPEASWEALAAEREVHARLAAERHARWRPAAAGRKPPLDGSFAFVVIGPAAGRFRLEIAADGEVRRVDNRMTDRWLNGEFGRFVGDWDAAGSRPGAPLGYWFWNRGEPAPFRWEPATYRALASALALLGDVPEVSSHLAAAVRVVEILAPGASGRIAAGTETPPIERREEPRPGGESAVVSRARGREVRLERTVVRSAEGLARAGHLALEVDRPQASLRLSVGYRPAAVEDGSRE